MNEIILRAMGKIEKLASAVPQGKHIITGDIRKLSAKLFRELEDKTIGNVLALCEELLEQQSWALGVIAYDWAFRVRGQYNEATYDVFYSWLKRYVRGWGDCDDFCTHAFGALLRRYKPLFAKITDWTADKDFWVRRASAVILIPAILHNDYEGLYPYQISDLLMYDGHDLVQKGYGWMLKCLSTAEMESVKEYLALRHKEMPRTAFRYALEKFDEKIRKELMAL